MKGGWALIEDNAFPCTVYVCKCIVNIAIACSIYDIRIVAKISRCIVAGLVAHVHLRCSDYLLADSFCLLWFSQIINAGHFWARPIARRDSELQTFMGALNDYFQSGPGVKAHSIIPEKGKVCSNKHIQCKSKQTNNNNNDGHFTLCLCAHVHMWSVHVVMVSWSNHKVYYVHVKLSCC